MTPAVTLFSRPSRLPMAIASSPSRGCCSRNFAAGSPVRSTFTTARSLTASAACTLPGTRRPSAKATSTAPPEAEATTCWLVTMTPSER